MSEVYPLPFFYCIIEDFEFLENSAGLQAERVNPIVSGVPNIKPRKKSTGKIDLTGIKKQRDQATKYMMN